MKKEELFEKAKKGDKSILDDPNCSLVRDICGNTPLHYLARSGKIEVLSHKDCSRVKGVYSRTPLHFLAMSGKIEVLSHRDCSLVKDILGRTPLHWLAMSENLEFFHLEKLFPWYKRKCKGKVTEEEISEILNTPNSIQYILEED